MATYLAGKKYTVTIDGAEMAVQSGTYTTTTGVDETTNLTGDGYYEDIDTIKRATVSLQCVYDGDEPPDFDEGDIVALSINLPGVPAVTGPPAIDAIPGGPALSGNFRITSMRYPSVSPNAAVKYDFDANSQRAYVKGQSPTP